MSRQAADGWIVSAPLPVRLLGSVLDDLELPALVAALDLRTAVAAVRRDDGLSSVRLPGRDPENLDLSPDAVPLLPHVLAVLAQKGIGLSRGWDFTVHTRALDPEAVALSPALAVAWVTAVLAVEARLSDLSGEGVAAVASEALARATDGSSRYPEVRAAALGGVLLVRPHKKDSLAAERALPELVVARLRTPLGDLRDSAALKRDTAEAIRSLRGVVGDFTFGETAVSQVAEDLNALPDALAGMVYGYLAARDICRQAWDVLEAETGLDDDAFGEMLDDTHGILRDYFAVTSLEAEDLAAAARNAGALGCTLCADGATLVAFAPGKAEAVADAMRKAGANARVAPIGLGMRVDHVPKTSEE